MGRSVLLRDAQYVVGSGRGAARHRRHGVHFVPLLFAVSVSEPHPGVSVSLLFPGVRILICIPPNRTAAINAQVLMIDPIPTLIAAATGSGSPPSNRQFVTQPFSFSRP